MIEKIKPDDMSFDVLMNSIKEGTIKIPDFQRNFVWERTQIINLLDSIYHHYPIGSFLFWESKESICSYRNIGNIQLKEAPKDKAINYVLDGQQRITSLFASLEEAEIKIKINGKQYHKKLEIYFDLDTKEFSAKKEIKEETSNGKWKGIWLFPRKGDYVENLIEILKAVNTDKHTDDSLVNWFMETFSVAKASSKAYVKLLKTIGFAEDSNKHLVLSYLGKEFLETKSPDVVIKLLLRNVEVFEELVETILEKGEVNAQKLREDLEDNSDVDWQTTEQILYRLKWLWKLGYGKYAKDMFTLDQDKKEELQKAYDEEKAIEKETIIPEKEIKIISIRDIIDDNKMFEVFQTLTSERQQAFKKVHSRFKNYKFSVIYIKEQPIGTVCSIFERINNSGTPLSVVDLMVAKTWSKEFNLKDKLFEFQKELKNNNYEDIADIIILQCISTHFQGRCHRKDILKLELKYLIKSWKQSTEAIKKTVDFIKTNLNISNSKLLPFGALLIPLSYFFFKIGNTDETNQQTKALLDWFWKACISNRFDSAVEGRVAEDVKNIDLIIRGKEPKFNYIIPLIKEQRLMDQNYSLRNAFCKTIMCIYAYNKPLHLENNKPVDFNSFSKFNSIEYHHIFSQNYLKKEQSEFSGMKDSIVNIAFIPAQTNKKFRDKSPTEYLGELTNPELEKAFKSHYIKKYTESGLMEDDFEKFLNYRAKAIIDTIKSLVGEFTQVEKGMLENEEKQINKFEKNIRKLIDDKLKIEDKSYWTTKLNQDFTSKVEERITQWLTKHPHENREKLNPIDFCLVMDYYRIIKMKWDIFEPIFKSRTELEKQFLYINELRNAIKHSRGVDIATRKHAEASLVWFEQILNGVKK